MGVSENLNAMVVILSLEEQPAKDFLRLIRGLAALPRRFPIKVLARNPQAFALPADVVDPVGTDCASQVASNFSQSPAAPGVVRVVVCDAAAALTEAARLKLATPWPTALVVYREKLEPLPDSRHAQWLHDKMVSVNLMPTAAHQAYYARENRGGPKGKSPLPLNNPVILEQPRFPGMPERTLEYTLESLLTGNRQPSWLARPKRDYSHIRLTYVTHFYINQKSPETIFSLFEGYSRYAVELLDQIHFVVVDDGSPVAYEPCDFGLNLTWLRIDEDIPWNIAGARNLGLVYAKSENVIVTDVDHAFPEETFRRVAALRPVGKRIYRFWRRREQGAYYGPHSNTFLLARSRFFEFFGYDEEFAGAYGAEDTRFLKFQKAQGTNAWKLPRRYWCYERFVDHTCSYHSLPRDLSFNTGADSRKRLELEYFGGTGAGHSRNFLDFRWRVLLDACRPAPPLQTRPDRGWKIRWLLRQLLPRLN
jgi:hypothetical protein